MKPFQSRSVCFRPLPSPIPDSVETLPSQGTEPGVELRRRFNPRMCKTSRLRSCTLSCERERRLSIHEALGRRLESRQVPVSAQAAAAKRSEIRARDLATQKVFAYSTIYVLVQREVNTWSGVGDESPYTLRPGRSAIRVKSTSILAAIAQEDEETLNAILSNKVL